MGAHHISRLWAALLVLVVSCTAATPAQAYDNPELLPDHATPVIDLARVFSEPQRTELERSLERFEAETGWKLRVLTQYERTPGLAVREFWGLDESSLLLVADPRGGNLLNFNVGDAFFALMPRTYWVDLPLEQWLLTLSTSVLGGLVAGFAAYPRKDEETIAWSWLLLLSPLWVMLFGVFGIAPVITRTSDLLPILRNSMGFLGSAVGAYLIAQATLGRRLQNDAKG